MKDHSHPEPVKCAHDLGWCAKCERPYCKTCGQEWYAPKPLDESGFKWKLRPDDQVTPGWPRSVPPPAVWYDTRPPREISLPRPEDYGYPAGTVLCEHKA